MARITIEDCSKVITNRFELVVLAAERARRLRSGDQAIIYSESTIPVLALKEIASGKIDIEKLRQSFISTQQTINSEIDDVEINDIDIILPQVNIAQENEYVYGYGVDNLGDNTDMHCDDLLIETD